MAISFQVKGMKRITRKIQVRLDRYEKQRDHIFAEPLARTIGNIRRQLSKDNQNGFNHVYTGLMYQQTKWESKVLSMREMEIEFGYYVPYGMAFEKGAKPRTIPLSVLKPWSQVRFGATWPAYPIQRNIRLKGTPGYGIIVRTWENNQDAYLKIVHRRFWRIWT